jgi:CO/xanthine dehydrogenase Mo-binding subunit
MTILGESLQRVDALDKVKGKISYGTDFSLPNMLCAQVLRSPLAHAKILNVDVRRAQRVSGVEAVLTGKDVMHFGLYGFVIKDQPILAFDRVRYIGDPVAAVSGVDLDAVEEALSLIKVDYEELEPIFDPVTAMESTRVLVHEDVRSYEYVSDYIVPIARSNICSHFKLRVGDIDEGFKAADEIFDDHFATQTQANCCLEPRMSLALADDSGALQVWSSTQGVYLVLRGLCSLFKIPQNKIQVIAPELGGGFGTKIYLKAEPIAVALALCSTGRPVKFQWTRNEEFIASTVRHPSTIRLKTGIKKDGTLTAREIKIIWDTGGYADIGPMTCRNGSFSAPGPYMTPHVKVDGYCVYTNKIMGGAMRGFGLPQPTFAIESQMDVIAERMGIDPLEIRIKNGVEEGSISASHQLINHSALKECIREAGRISNWSQRKNFQVGQGPVLRGRGIAIMHKGTFTPTCSSAFVKINSDGTVNLLCATANLGQGTETGLSQIAAEILGIPFDRVKVSSSDTGIAPYDRSTTSSRSIYHMGHAVKLASLDARKDLIEMASEYFEASSDEVVLENGIVYPKGRPSEGMTIEQLMKKHFNEAGTILGKGVFHTRGGNISLNNSMGDNFSAFWMYGCAVADVEVDSETGKVKVLKIVSANDVGKAINPSLCKQQIEGGIMMGLGYALQENLISDKGKILNDNLMDYKIPTFADSTEIIPILIEKPDPHGPFGAKGIAEESIVPVAPAIANAVYHATGVRIMSLTITPEKVLKGLRGKGKSSHERF